MQVILFSDILTPLTGMNIPFDIVTSKGPIIHKPIRTAEDVAEVRPLDPDQALPYVGETLRILRKEVRTKIKIQPPHVDLGADLRSRVEKHGLHGA